MQKLYKSVTKEHLHDWFDLEFSLPEDTVELYLKVKSPGKVHTMLYGPDAYRGMLDKDKDEIIIKEDFASKGFLPGLIPGLWKIKVEILDVPHEMTIEIDVETKYAHKSWYAGDFHTHSVHSDGQHEVDDMVSIAKAYGLDFFALTDHNSYAQNDKVVDDFVILPGLELTTPKGHSNFVGIKRPFDSFDYRTKESLYKMFDQGMDAGCFISVNHPFVGDVWRWGFDMKFHAIELWNGTPLSRNQGALDWWQDQLSRGRRILATGGSDVHIHDESGRCFGRGRTLVLADALSKKHLLEGLHRGNISVATCEKSGFVDLKIGQARVGETYYLSDEKQLKLEIDLQMDEPSELKLYTNEGLVASYNLDGHEVSKNLLIPVGHKFYRLELWGRNNTHAFFTNPIYIERQKMHTI